MLAFLKNLLTKADNQTFDEIKVGIFIVLVSASIAVVNASWLCVWLIVVKGKDAFDANAYLSGVGAYLTGCAALVGAGGVGMGARDYRRRDDAPPPQ